MEDNSVTLHRVIKTSPQKIFRAFTEALALAAWLPPYGFVCEVHELDARVGGHYKMSQSENLKSQLQEAAKKIKSDYYYGRVARQIETK